MKRMKMNSWVILTCFIAVVGAASNTLSLSKTQSSVKILPTSPVMALSSDINVSPASAAKTLKSSTHSIHVSPSTVMHKSSLVHSTESSAHMSSSAIPVTTPKTTTTPKPTDLDFTVKGKDDKVCIYFKGEVNLIVVYVCNSTKTTNTTTIQLKEIGGKASGSCFEPKKNITKANLTLSWKYTTFSFNFDLMKDSWFMTGIAVEIVTGPDTVPDAKYKRLVASQKYNASTNDGFLEAHTNHSYSCPRDVKRQLVSDASSMNDYNITVDFKTVDLQPFHSEKPFANPYVCKANTDDNTTSSIVPIAVGGALAGLIVIVLIAYLIGRRRSNRGYQQV